MKHLQKKGDGPKLARDKAPVVTASSFCFISVSKENLQLGNPEIIETSSPSTTCSTPRMRSLAGSKQHLARLVNRDLYLYPISCWFPSKKLITKLQRKMQGYDEPLQPFLCTISYRG